MSTATMRLQWYSLPRERTNNINKNQLKLFLNVVDVEKIYYDEKEDIYVEEVSNNAESEILRVVDTNLKDMSCYISMVTKE